MEISQRGPTWAYREYLGMYRERGETCTHTDASVWPWVPDSPTHRSPPSLCRPPRYSSKVHQMCLFLAIFFISAELPRQHRLLSSSSGAWPRPPLLTTAAPCYPVEDARLSPSCPHPSFFHYSDGGVTIASPHTCHQCWADLLPPATLLSSWTPKP